MVLPFVRLFVLSCVGRAVYCRGLVRGVVVVGPRLHCSTCALPGVVEPYRKMMRPSVGIGGVGHLLLK